MSRRVAIVLAVLLSSSCEAIRELQESNERLIARCKPGIAEERDLPLTDAKITSTVRMMAERDNRQQHRGTIDEMMLAELEAGGLNCGRQLAVFSKVRKSIDVLRERRGLPKIETKHRRRSAGLLQSDAAKALTDADIALVDARFDEVNGAVERYVAPLD